MAPGLRLDLQPVLQGYVDNVRFDLRPLGCLSHSNPLSKTAFNVINEQISKYKTLIQCRPLLGGICPKIRILF